MGIPRYNGDMHPEVYIKEMRVYCNFRQITEEKEIVKFCKMMVDSTIKISSEIESCDDLVKALRGHVSFSIFKEASKRKLHKLKYNLESEGGDTPKFIADFRMLIRDAEVNDVELQKNYLYYTLPNDFFRNQFIKKFEDEIDTLDELIGYFEYILAEYSKFILNGSVVALKHVSTGKYLSSSSRNYKSGSKSQMVYCGKSLRDSNSLWTIKCFNSPELLPYDSVIYLQHINTNNYLEICTDRHNKSPLSGFTEVSCGSNNNYSDYTWVLVRGHESRAAYLKTHDTIILRNKYPDYLSNQQKEEVLSSHSIDFTIDDIQFQEIFAHDSKEHNENDSWCIERIE